MKVNNIKSLRLRKDVTQDELHKKTGLSRQFLCDLENGKYNLTLGTKIKIAEALEVTLEEIQGG